MQHVGNRVISNRLIGHGDQTPIPFPRRGRGPAASRSTRLGGRGAVALAPHMAAQAGDPAEHGRQRRRDHRRGPAVDRDVNGLPCGRVQHGVTGQLGGSPPQHGQVLNPPGDDQVQGLWQRLANYTHIERYPIEQ